MQKGGSKGRILKGVGFDPKQLGGERKVCYGGGRFLFPKNRLYKQCIARMRLFMD